ncbi:hypothetical protein K461DRAFT_282459 [Myriangium duriaei CBS 260.36]|uniref:ADP-ribose 1''-phosphate phosphatase n=1 Tax=Myriangium duriaei CBS 260.36 TaxID=1168546 RepID=A0A9P4MCQ0_9PEZI|nr:hypothetical protein K461DRAFT_282459 [Myriangium duriaei CBS 260.36]
MTKRKLPPSCVNPFEAAKRPHRRQPGTTRNASPPTPAAPLPPAATNPFLITEEKGDIFSAPPGTLLIHACNCVGHWGAGIAAAFKQRYPAAYTAMKAHCATHGRKALPGTGQLITPEPAAEKDDADGEGEVEGGGADKHTEDEGDSPTATTGRDDTGGKRSGVATATGSSGKGKVTGKRHFVGNLYTSENIGARKDSKAKILANTGPAMRDLLQQVAAWNEAQDENRVEQIWMCKINSGLFGVKWEDTKRVLESIERPEGDVPAEIKVVSP